MANLAYSFRILTPSLVRAACGHLPANRRGEMRRALRLGCRVRRRDGRLVGDRTMDLSPQGMLLCSDERIPTGSELLVSFQATDLSLWFDAQATVRRVVEGRRPGDGGRAIGLHFESFPAVSRLILRGHLCKATPVFPQREPPPELVPRPVIDYAEAVRRVMLER